MSRPVDAGEQIDDLVVLLDLVRHGGARTRPELARRSGLGRTVVSARLTRLLDAGLVTEGELGPSTGGRAPRELRLRAEAGVLLVAEVGATGFTIGVTDLDGTLLADRHRVWDVDAGPEATLARVADDLDDLRADAAAPAPVWGVGVGLPGPVEFASGRPIAPPIMPGWDAHPVREHLAARFDAPVWVDNDVNTMALGELRHGIARDVADLLYVKIGTGIGAGLVTGGRLQRGAQGAAGDLGHTAVHEDSGIVCRCGNRGCLEALAGGGALARDALTLARAGHSDRLATRLAAAGGLTARDVVDAAGDGDQEARRMLQHAGALIGTTLSVAVNLVNPAMVLLGGRVGASSDLVLAAVRDVVYRRSLPLATRELRIEPSPLSGRAGLLGAAAMVLDELLAPACLTRWLEDGSPAGRPEIA
jgi:predicted NBD/HSP70 family sugar kinase